VSILEAIILGIVQGLTEFFPVSSDGHLVLVPFVAGWEQPSLAFIVATHIGTFIALVRVFWLDVVRLIETVLRWGQARAEDRKLVTSEDIGARDAAIIGTAQTTALLPGISRSGMTIIAGLRLGLTRPVATRFSFLLSIPIIFGAIVFQLKDMISEGAGSGFGVFAVGIVASAVSGFWAIRTFLRLVQTRTLRPFGTYLLLAMVAGLLTALARG
jgi:undecaprenyl-diphosphatase